MLEYQYYFEKDNKVIELDRHIALKVIKIKGICDSCPLCTRRYSPINANGQKEHTTFYDCNKLGLSSADCYNNIDRYIMVKSN